MNSRQLEALLDQIGLSQRAAARALNINERTMRKYIAGDAEVPRTVELSLTRLRMDKEHAVLLAELDNARNEMHAPFSTTFKKMSAIANGTSRENPTLAEIRTASDAMERFDKTRRRLKQFCEDNVAAYEGWPIR